MPNTTTLQLPWCQHTRICERLRTVWHWLSGSEWTGSNSPESFANAMLTDDPENIVLFAEWLRAETNLQADRRDSSKVPGTAVCEHASRDAAALSGGNVPASP